MRLRVVERLVHRAREAVDHVAVLLDVLLRGDVDAVRESGQGLHRRRVDLRAAAGEHRAQEGLGEQRGVDTMVLQRRRHLGKRNLEQLHLVVVDALLLERPADHDLGEPAEGVHGDGLARQVIHAADGAPLRHHERLPVAVLRGGGVVARRDDLDRQVLGDRGDRRDHADERELVLVGHQRRDQRGAALADVRLDLQALGLEEALLHAEIHGRRVGDGQRANRDRLRTRRASARTVRAVVSAAARRCQHKGRDQRRDQSATAEPVPHRISPCRGIDRRQGTPRSPTTLPRWPARHLARWIVTRAAGTAPGVDRACRRSRVPAHRRGEAIPAGATGALHNRADDRTRVDQHDARPTAHAAAADVSNTTRGAERPSPHPKYRRRGGLFQAPGCAPYSLAASDEGSNGMGAEEHAAVVAEGDPTGTSTLQADCYVLGLEEIDKTHVAVVGGKGAALGELSHIDGIRVPPGFCVTTNAVRRITAAAPSIDGLLERLSRLSPGDRNAIRELSAEIRRTLEGIAIPDDVAAAVTVALARAGEQAASAVRSSATAEDLPTASFAGQHDSYLNVVGPAAILRHVSRACASLFTERAVTYRLRNGFDHRKVHMAVVVQEMVVPHAAGILFTADPLTSNRMVASVEAVLGLGEALVSGRVNADSYKVRDGEVVARAVADEPALTDAQAVRLAQLGRQIEAHFGRPQDIEWCLVDDGFAIVQSRPITTLFPIPAADDGENHVYVSVGHQQMMTDPMKPLGLSLFQLTALRPMYEAGGRLFVDVAKGLASPAVRAGLLGVLGKGDPLIGDALRTVVERDFVPSIPDDAPGPAPARDAPAAIETDPAIVTALIERGQASNAALERAIRPLSGSALLDFILADIEELRRLLSDPRSHQVFLGAMAASAWLNEKLQEWLGETSAADTLTQSVPHNVTSEMGLALLDVADAIRPHPEVVAFLQDVEDEDFLDELPGVAGGPEARDAIAGFLAKYGMRCVGEIDIT